MRQAWLCDSCNAAHNARCSMWTCPGCGKECCDSCFECYGHCESCAEGKTEEELRLAANATGDFDFEPAKEPE